MPWPKGRKATTEHRAKNAEAVRQWHHRMTSDEREAYAAKQRASQPKGLTLDRRITKRTVFVKGHAPMHTEEGVRKMAETKVMKPLIADAIVSKTAEHQDRIDRIIDGLMNGPVTIAAAWLKFASDIQLKRREAAPSLMEHEPWLAYVTEEELAVINEIVERAEARMRDGERRADTPRPALPPSFTTDDDADEVLL